MTKKLLFIVAIALVIIAGCNGMYDMWPTSAPEDLVEYSEADPNVVSKPWPTLGTVKNLREKAITKHIIAQIDLKHEMEKDTAKYGRAIEQADINITTAQEERAAMVGSIQNPGWLLGALLAATGAGAYFVGYRTQRPEDYNESEHQNAVASSNHSGGSGSIS